RVLELVAIADEPLILEQVFVDRFDAVHRGVVAGEVDLPLHGTARAVAHGVEAGEVTLGIEARVLDPGDGERCRRQGGAWYIRRREQRRNEILPHAGPGRRNSGVGVSSAQRRSRSAMVKACRPSTTSEVMCRSVMAIRRSVASARIIPTSSKPR